MKTSSYPSFKRVLTVLLATALWSCSENQSIENKIDEQVKPQNRNMQHHSQGPGKPVIYQVFTRLFGNKNTTNKPWGTIEENGVGKFSDFDDRALEGIAELGTSYIWYTGVPHHAVIRDYREYGISLDDPDVVKGRAGSPYAVKDYYNVNPDLADDPAKRLQEFEALIQRTHKHGMKVIIDIVPNHVARNYQSTSAPKGVVDFGAHDDTSVSYDRDNNFYYIVGEEFSVPQSQDYQALGGDSHPLLDGEFVEVPAKWTGNGARKAQPDMHDWYETVKVNYGVKPDGSYDFPKLPGEYREQDYNAHFTFWQDKDLPDSWYKFEQIVHYWLDKGVDGFRFDMAEMVPVEFWSFLNSSIKRKKQDSLLLAEVYNPDLYRDYIQLGLMDYLYDKVGFYDDLKAVMQGHGDTAKLEINQSQLSDIEQHMLHFLENHDEQRIASPDFAGSAEKGKPALVTSALISRSPTMLYFGQDVGEDGSEEPGFGDPTRTSIFDYIGVPAHQRWMNNGEFDSGQLSEQEVALRQFYVDVMNISAYHPVMTGEYVGLHGLNNDLDNGYSKLQFAFSRFNEDQALVVISNFAEEAVNVDLQLPIDLVVQWKLENGSYTLIDLLSDEKVNLNISEQGLKSSIQLNLPANASKILELTFSKSVIGD
ncbi:alpha-amylase family glycosyl hydrolase [Glaciecola sp. 1036]|uniref:alpha-amylase family glycosyl hydrolase n=1 Tax=Alteromonadaceae TaxID=72275 RepID=UPI003CFE0C60